MSETEVQNQDTKEVNASAPPKDEGLDRKTLFVRSIPLDATSEQLSEYFSQFVPVKHAVIVTDDQKQSRGFGFVSFTLEDDTLTALVESKKNKFKNRLLRVDIAKRRERKEQSSSDIKKEIAPIEKRRARLIIRNLPWSCKNPDTLKKLFSRFGGVFDAYIPKKRNGQMLGFAFVVMKKKAGAEKAIKESGGLKIDGREVAVDYAVEKSKWEQVKEEEDDEEDDEEEEEDDDDENENENENDDEDEDNEDNESEETDEEELEINGALETQPETKPKPNRQEAFTIFVRNIPYDATAESLKEHFKQFGPVKYALPVVDKATGLARGSAFVAFFKESSYAKCVDNCPQIESTTLLIADDVSPEYVYEGRVLNISSAVDRTSADKLKDRNTLKRMENQGKDIGDGDKRNVFLLNEGRITSNSKLAQFMSKTDMEVRDKSYKLRVDQLNKNPSLHLSLTRLAVRNIPRSMNSKALKALGRQAVVNFATEVKQGLRQPLSKEEINRSVKAKHEGEEDNEAQKSKKSKHAGVVKQAKVIMEVKGASESTGRSRGYGFIEFRDHKSALMGLRWLNAHEVTKDEIFVGLDDEGKKLAEVNGFTKRRLVVEFAVENAQVVKRRKEKVGYSRVKKTQLDNKKQEMEKQKREEEQKRLEKKRKSEASADVKQIIGKKRKQRKTKK